VVVLESQIIGRAANQSALKNAFLSNLHTKGWCVRHRLKIKTGTKYWLCPGCSNYKFHSESRAVEDAHKNHQSIAGAELYLWGHWWCCQPCWQVMLTAGIKNVYVTEDAHLIFHGSRNKS
jgi:deoxycytidylate deaminase